MTIGYHNEIEGFEIKSPKMLEIYKEIEVFAEAGFNLIIYGPTGSGKEFLARHYYKVFKKKHDDPGPLYSVNCRGFSNNSAKSELFGHTIGAFTDATYERDGAFISAKNGVLFLDEIGELSEDVQALLYRAIDPGEAQKLGSDKFYDTTNVAIIGATDKSPDELKKQLRFRVGQVIKVPCLDERKEDIPGAICFFINNMFYDHQYLLKKAEKMMPETGESHTSKDKKDFIKKLCQKITEELVPLVEGREWPGNFRSLNSVISSSMVKVEFLSEKSYIKEVKKHFIQFADRESLNIKSHAREINPDIMKAIDANFDRWKKDEKKHWAEVLSSFGNKSFKRSDLESKFVIKARALQNKLKALSDAGIISSSGEKGDIYKVALNMPVANLEDIPETVSPKFSSFELPKTSIDIADREEEVNNIIELLKSETNVFVSGESQSGKTTVAILLGKALEKSRDVFYYELSPFGLNDFIQNVFGYLEQRGFEKLGKLNPGQAFMMHLDAAALTGYIDSFFSTRKNPVFIIDNIHKLKSRQDLDTLQVILHYWKSLSFVFTGDKLSNELVFGQNARMIEFKIKRFA